MENLGYSHLNLGVTFWPLPLILLILLPIGFSVASNGWSTLADYVGIAWMLGFPIIIISIIGGFKSRNVKMSRFDRKISDRVIFQIPTVARNDTLPAVQRVIDSILASAPMNLDNWKINVIVEEKSEGRDYLTKKYSQNNRVEVIAVPADYQTRYHSLSKSRANQYAIEYLRAKNEIERHTWIYHLDDDTSICPETISAIAEHIYRYGDIYYLAQGILSFPHSLSKSFIAKFADSMRPTDDLTRFYFFTNILKLPLIGLHGENMLVRSDIEESVGWDNGDRAMSDDSCFALNFAYMYPGKSAFMPAVTFGASPANVKDMLKQRKRWFLNVSNLSFYGKVPFRYRLFMIYTIIFWFSMVFQNVIFVLFVLRFFGIFHQVIITPPIVILWAFTLSFWIWFYISGLRINMELSGKRKGILKYSLIMIPMYLFVISPLELAGGFLGFISFLKNEKKFDVISKPI